jgi:dihydroflavonol-4-reductase
MKVAVTGATGHVGANLVRALVERGGHQIRALVHDDDSPLAGLPVEKLRADVRDLGALRQAFEGVERVFHLAARISIAPGDGALVEAINVGGTRNVVEACLGAGVKRLIHFSSIHALSPEPRSAVVDENRPLAEGSWLPYDRSKAAAELEIRKGVERGLDAVTVNPTAVLGPHDYRPSQLGSVLLDLYRRRLPGLVDGGFDWVDVRDVVAGALAAADHGNRGERYLLGGARRSIAELASAVEKVTGSKAPRFVSPMWLARASAPFATGWARLTGRPARLTAESLHALRNHQQVSHEKAGRELGYRPRPLEDTVAATFDWFKEAHVV